MPRPFLAILLVASLARAQRPAFPDLTIPDALGVNIHFTDPKPGEMELLAAAGFKFIRMDFTWGGTERKKGEYDFSRYQRLLQSLEPHGIRALFILDYSNKLYDEGLSPHSAEARAAMARWAAAAVTQFKGRGIVWEMWNEPNIKQFWKPAPNVDDYARLSNEVGKAIRAAAPEELFVGPATSQIDLKFLESCFAAGCLEYWDAVSVHPYRQKTPETANDEYRKLRDLIARYAPAGRKIPILSGEWGYSAAWKNFDADIQGKFLPREMLLNLYNEIPLSIWYDWHDDGPDAKEAEHHFGTVKHPYLKDQTPVYEPKPAYLAMKTLSTQLNGFKYNKRLVMEDEKDWVLMFSKGDEVRLAAWTTGAAHEVTLPASKGKFRVVNHLGDKTFELDGDLKLSLADTVQYITPTIANARLQAAAKWETAPLEVRARGPARLRVLDREIDVARSPEPVPALLRMANDPAFAQRTSVQSSNPLHAELLPEVERNGLPAMVVRVTSAAKEPEAMTVKIERGEHIYKAEVAQSVRTGPSGQPRYAFFEMGCPAQPTYAAALRLTNDADQTLLALPKRTYRTLPNFQFDFESIVENWKPREWHPFQLIPDGDAKVSSAQSIARDKSPRGKDEPYVPFHAAKLTYSFDAGWKYVRVTYADQKHRVVEGKPKDLGLWVRGDGTGNVLRLRFTDAQGQTFQPEGHKLDFKGWRWLKIAMDGRDAIHWGRGDGTVQYPIRWDSILLLDSASREKTSGGIWFTGMTLIE